MLDRYQGVYGDRTVIDDDPSILQYENALFIPYNSPDSPAGLYDSGRKLISASAYYRGPDLAQPHFQTCSYRFEDISSHAGSENFFYAGHLHSHFGHFLLSSFCRFWPFADPNFRRSSRIIVHSHESIDAYLSARPFVTDLLQAIEIDRSCLTTFTEPTRIRRLRVIAPSFEETSFAHAAFARLGNRAGSVLAQHIPEASSPRPAWFSKERLGTGNRRVINERELTQMLAKAGIDIVFPEQLTMAETAALWRDRPAVGAFVGSALHSSILAPGRCIVGISDSRVIMSSFLLMDEVNNARNIYYGVIPSQLVNISEVNGFTSGTYMPHPEIIADSVLAAFEDIQRRGLVRSEPLSDAEDAWHPRTAVNSRPRR